MKKFKIIILNDAIQDFNDALHYYRNINPKLAQKLYTSVDATLKHIKQTPFYQIRYDQFRMKTVKGFPYIIHYIIVENMKLIEVYGIRNSYSNPSNYPLK
jgi:toxin ParE1/3/4